MADIEKVAVPGFDRQIEPHVESRANPVPADLLEVRAEVQSTPRLQELFRKAHAEKWSADHLSDLLTTELVMARPEGTSDPTEAARFLADEYTQYGPVGVQLISTATGKIAAIVREEDIYQPAPVAREGQSTLAIPLPRIRPDLEAAVVTWFHDKGREERVVEALAARGHQTALLREMGDPRLLVATKKGRRHIVESLSKIEPKALLEAAGGNAGTFLRFFDLVSEEPGEHVVKGLTHISGEVSAKSVMGVQDPLTTNLHHNRPATLRAALVGGWLRQIARHLSLECGRSESVERGVLDLVAPTVNIPEGFWIADPDFVRPMRERSRKVSVFPVESSKPLFIAPGTLGVLQVPTGFEALSQELFDRWETSAYLKFDMWVDLSRVRSFEIFGVEVFAQVL